MKRILSIFDHQAVATTAIALTLATIVFSLALELWTLFAIVDIAVAIVIGLYSEQS